MEYREYSWSTPDALSEVGACAALAAHALAQSLTRAVSTHAVLEDPHMWRESPPARTRRLQLTASRVRLTQGEARAIGNSMKAIWLGHHVPANAAREIVAACARLWPIPP